MQPIIITKDKLQKQVYGLGYPSLPVLSVDEFYEKRIEEGWWKPPSSGGALQDRATDPDLEARMKENEEREEDDKVDRDDEEAREPERGDDDARCATSVQSERKFIQVKVCSRRNGYTIRI